MGSGRLNASAPEFTPPGGLSSQTEPGISTSLTTGGESATHEESPVTSEEATVSVPTLPTLPIAPLDALSMSLLAQQLPPLPNFIGDRLDEDGETFEEWLERLELIAATCHWDERAKLVNIATRLRGPALRFYRTCSPQQRASYALLTSALKQRFTPVRIQAVQSSRFHERKQGPKESVDSYAQDLRRLFNRAYSSVSASGDGDQMRQSVLAYQFVAGLRSELKAKLVGREGTFEQLLEVARFEEARFRDVVQQERATRRNSTPSSGPPPTGGTPRQDTLTSTSSRLTARTCYHCGATGHIARDCPQRGRGAPKESQSQTQGRMQSKTQGQNTDNSKKQKVGVGLLQPGSGGTQSPPASDVLGQALAQAMTTLFGVSPAAKDRDSTMGPTLTSQAYLDGTPTAALVDTGSPVSIVSSDFFLKAAAAKKEPSQTPSTWGEAVK